MFIPDMNFYSNNKLYKMNIQRNIILFQIKYLNSDLKIRN